MTIRAICNRIVLINRKVYMIKDKTFRITYYSNKDKKHITRFGKFDDKCKYWTSKVGTALITYFDLDKQEYRTAKDSWKVRY